MIPQSRYTKTRSIGFLVFPNCELLDVTGPLNVFSFANRWLQMTGRTSSPVYQLDTLAAQTGPITTTAGLAIYSNRAYRDADGRYDTLIVAGGEGVEQSCYDAALVAWIKQHAPHTRRLVSICTGAFLLAACGLLDSRRATTHWYYCRRLAQAYPSLQVIPDVIFVKDGNVYTSGGITAGIDLALALVEEDLGSEAAMEVARYMVVFLRRPGGQSQISTYLNSRISSRHDLRELQAWMISHPDSDLNVEALAERVAMSPRNFARLFLKETGTTPAKFVEQLRLEAARCQLEETSIPLEIIAEQCGFGNAERMRATFQRVLNINPNDYRHRTQDPGNLD